MSEYISRSRSKPSWLTGSRSSSASFTSTPMGDRVEISWESSLVSNGSSGTTVETTLDFCLRDSLSSSTFGFALPTFPLGTEIKRTVLGSVGGCLLFPWLFFEGLGARETASTMYAAWFHGVPRAFTTTFTPFDHSLRGDPMSHQSRRSCHASDCQCILPNLSVTWTTYRAWWLSQRLHGPDSWATSTTLTLGCAGLAGSSSPLTKPLQQCSNHRPYDPRWWRWHWKNHLMAFKISPAIPIENCFIAQGFIRFTRSRCPWKCLQKDFSPGPCWLLDYTDLKTEHSRKIRQDCRDPNWAVAGLTCDDALLPHWSSSAQPYAPLTNPLESGCLNESLQDLHMSPFIAWSWSGSSKRLTSTGQTRHDSGTTEASEIHHSTNSPNVHLQTSFHRLSTITNVPSSQELLQESPVPSGNLACHGAWLHGEDSAGTWNWLIAFGTPWTVIPAVIFTKWKLLGTHLPLPSGALRLLSFLPSYNEFWDES